MFRKCMRQERKKEKKRALQFHECKKNVSPTKPVFMLILLLQPRTWAWFQIAFPLQRMRALEQRQSTFVFSGHQGC